jgi:hypothetical protein
MAYNSRQATSYLYMLDRDWIVTIEYTQLNNGYKGSAFDPPEPPDYDIDRIWLSEDLPGYEGPQWELTGKMFQLLAANDKVLESVQEDIFEN